MWPFWFTAWFLLTPYVPEVYPELSVKKLHKPHKVQVHLPKER